MVKNVNIARIDEYIRVNGANLHLDLNFYMAETMALISNYRSLRCLPVTMSFVVTSDQDKIADGIDPQIYSLTSEYLAILKRYGFDTLIDLKQYENRNYKVGATNTSNPTTLKCPHCLQCKDFEILDDMYICAVCSSKLQILNASGAFNDHTRPSGGVKYEYDRKIHFKDTINQYCARQNCVIPEDVYTKLEEQVRMYHLIIDSGISREDRYANVTKEHIHKFLKELDLTKQNDNVHLIHYKLTGQKPDDISYLEDQLFTDFDLLVQTYDKLFHDTPRKNFIHSHIVLYQLLLKYNHKCDSNDFFILKTLEKQQECDYILECLFNELGWFYTPLI